MPLLPLQEINKRRPSKSRLIAIKRITNKKPYRIKCRCSCGNITIVSMANLNRSIFSCGCLKTEYHKKPKTKLGYYIPRKLQAAYDAMINRCYNKNTTYYYRYGGRGVRVCQKWIKSRVAFYEWALSNGWKEGLEIDKDIIGNGKFYSPSKCCIVTKKQNLLKTCRTLYCKYKGKKISFMELLKISGIPRNVLYARIYTLKMSINDAITKTFNKKTQTWN